MSKISPFLWFDNQAEEAVNFWTSVFKDVKIKNIARYSDAGPMPAGTAMLVVFEMFGQEFMALNGGPVYHFTEAISMLVSCDDQREVDEYWDKLAEGGTPIQCGWIKDKYGLAWQIVPKVLGSLMSEGTPEQSARVANAMFQMVKLDIAGLQRAFDGA